VTREYLRFINVVYRYKLAVYTCKPYTVYITCYILYIVTPFLRPSHFSFEMSFVTAESYACAYVAHLIAFLCLVYCLSLKW
jgi:hypothetical protein